MSFSSEVKNEIVGVIPKARHCQIAELAAIILFSANVTKNSKNTCIKLNSDSPELKEKYFTLLKKTISINENDCDEEAAILGKPAQDILELIKYDEDSESHISGLLLKETCCRRSFIRGAFLCAGSMSDPKKAYHLEIVCKEEAVAKKLLAIMNTFEAEARYIKRQGHYVVYMKEGERIVDMLNVIGATKSLMELENIRIVKEMRSTVNRRVNCETANIQKTVSAAVRQVEDIRYIEETIGISALPKNLQEMAVLRLENPESSLCDLGEMLRPPVGKSGVNHRLRRISEIAEKLRNE